MKALRLILLLAIAAAAGLLTSEAIFRSPQSRHALRRAVLSYLLGPEAQDELVIRRNLDEAAAGEILGEGEVDREVGLLRAQFADEAAFTAALEASELTPDRLRNEVIRHLRALAWTEGHILSTVELAEAHAMYERNRAQFMQPQRYRARHVFVAAPDGSPPELIAQKQSIALGLAVRILAGENLAQLAAEASEDEATKRRGGDLGNFSEWRVPPDFLLEIKKLGVGEISPAIRTRLGFHIIELMDVRPPREMSFDEAKGEIMLALRNEKRLVAVTELAQRLRGP